MKLNAFAPQRMSAPMELIAVMAPEGPITERQWYSLLSDRVSKLAMEEPNAMQILSLYSPQMQIPTPEEPSQAGQHLVDGNWNLKEHLSVAMYSRPPFPAKVTHSEDAMEAIEQTDLESWMELAVSMVSASNLD